MTSSVDIFSAVNRKSGRLGGLRWGANRRRTLLRQLCRRRKTRSWHGDMGDIACDFTRVFRIHLGGGWGVGGLDHSLTWLLVLNSALSNTRFPFPPYATLGTTGTCSEQCTYMTSHMQAGGGWLGHHRVHIQYTYLRKKNTLVATTAIGAAPCCQA